MLRVTPLLLIAALAAPAAAQAAPVKLRAAEVGSGTLSVAATNPNAYAVSGSASVLVGKQTLATRRVALKKKSSKTLTFDVTGKSGTATVTLKVRRAGGKTTTVKRTVALAAPGQTPPGAPSPSAPGAAPGTTAKGKAPATTPPAQPQPQPQTQAPAPQPPAPATSFVGRMGTDGAYDDFTITRDGGAFRLTKTPLVPVVCAENGGDYETALSYEPFVPAGPFTIGTENAVAQSGTSLNRLGGSSPRTITYKVVETAADATHITGKLSMSYFWSTYDPWSNSITFINCFGSQSFEAVPAP